MKLQGKVVYQKAILCLKRFIQILGWKALLKINKNIGRLNLTNFLAKIIMNLQIITKVFSKIYRATSPLKQYSFNKVFSKVKL